MAVMSSFRPPITHYARNGDLSLAYQTLGDGPIDLIFVPGMITHVEFLHEFPHYTDFLRRLAKFSRVVTFDKSGQGLSDRAFGTPSLEQRMDDVRAIMDDFGSKRAALLGCSEGAPISVMFAATYPERVSHLILFGGFARFTAAPGYPYIRTEEELTRRVEAMVKHWGTGSLAIRSFLPSQAGRPEMIELFGKLERLTFSPGALKAVYQQNSLIDIRPILPTVRVPTLVLHRKFDASISPENGRYLASQIPDCSYIEYGDEFADHLIFAGDLQRISADIEEFVTGIRSDVPSDSDRVLATVLFTDIVNSTQIASSMGDQGWRDRLDTHDALARKIVSQHRGNLIKTMGDGILATFDGPGRAIRCALGLQAPLHRIGLQIRAGLHTGEIELRNADIGGVAVHAAARVMSAAGPDEILVSRVLMDLVAGGGFTFTERGTHEFKGLPGRWDLFLAGV